MELMKCNECGQVIVNIFKEGHRICKICNLNLPLNEFREGHKRCRTCESLKYQEWRENNLEKWKKGGQYYKYVSKKKSNEIVNEVYDMQDKSE